MPKMLRQFEVDKIVAITIRDWTCKYGEKSLNILSRELRKEVKKKHKEEPVLEFQETEGMETALLEKLANNKVSSSAFNSCPVDV